jgi:hypothetical protein
VILTLTKGASDVSDKQPMQADGAGVTQRGSEEETGVADIHGAGESQGGAYPNPHDGTNPGHFDGGQSLRAYHGTGQLGDQKTGPTNVNSPSTI